jgi:hypothetical protein
MILVFMLTAHVRALCKIPMALEDLRITNMVRNRHLAKSILDTS